MDAAFAYSAHFALRVLVLPVHPIRATEYEKHLQLLRRHSRIALADVPPTPAPEASSRPPSRRSNGTTTPSSTISSLLAPTPNSRGSLNLDFVESWDSELQRFEDFELRRRVMAVIGIVDCTEWKHELADAASAFAELLEKRAPADPFAVRCYAFGPQDSQKDNAQGLVVIPSVGDLGFYINTLLAELCSNILAGLSSIMASLDNRQQIHAPAYAEIPVPTVSGESVVSPTDAGFASSIPDIKSAQEAPNALKSRVVSMAGLPVDNVESRLRKKLTARANKLRGDIYCVAGRLPEALGCYNDSLTAAKANNDLIWQAASTEGSILVQIYQAWLFTLFASNSSNHTSAPSLADMTEQPADAPLLLNTSLGKDLPPLYMSILSLYAKSAVHRNSTPAGSADGSGSGSQSLSYQDLDQAIHPLIYVETCLRCLRLHLALFLMRDAWEPKTTALLVSTSQAAWPKPSLVDILNIGLSSTSSRGDLLHLVNMAYACLASPQIASKTRLRCLSSLATIYGKLCMSRKRATILREIAAVAAVSTAKVQGRDGTPALPIGTSAGSVVKSRSTTGGDESLIRMMEGVCSTYGVSVIPAAELMSAHHQTTETGEAGRDMLRFGWPELQVAITKDAITLSEVLCDYQGAIRFTITALRELADAMPPGDQYRYSQSIPKLLKALSQRDPRFALAYWGPQNLIMTLEVAALPKERIPMQRNGIDMSAKSASSAAQLDVRNQFIHGSSRLEAKPHVKPLIVQGELAEFFVTLQNPYLFEFDISRIEVWSVSGSPTYTICRTLILLVRSTSGVDCKINTVRSSVPPSSFHTIRISCIPLSAGTLTVRGCRVQIAGSDVREFLVPIAEDGDDAPSRNKRTSLIAQRTRLKHLGLGNFYPRLSRSLSYNKRFMECQVVTEQPMLRVVSDSLVNGSLVLLVGESSPITLLIENSSSLPVDFLAVNFEDSVTRSMRARLAEDELSPVQAYELESNAIEQPVMKLHQNSDADLRLEPGAQHRLLISVLGCLNLESATIFIDYALRRRPSAAVDSDAFYTRQIAVPVNVSAHASVTCHSIGFVSATRKPRTTGRHLRSASITSLGRSLAVDNRLEEGLDELDNDTHCLLIAHLVNDSEQLAFEVTLSRKDQQDDRVRQKLEPQSSINLLLPMPRVRLSNEEVHRPIPSLTNKQFIVGKDTTNPAELELFWYRQSVLSSISMKWRELDTRKHGQISLQHLQLDADTLEVLRLDDLSIQSRLHRDSDLQGDLLVCKSGSWDVQEGSYVQVEVSVKNCLDRHIALVASLQARQSPTVVDTSHPRNESFNDPFSGAAPLTPPQISRNALIDGTPYRQIEHLGEGAIESIGFSMVFLAKGMYELVCQISEARTASTSLPAPLRLVRGQHIITVNVT